MKALLKDTITCIADSREREPSGSQSISMVEEGIRQIEGWYYIGRSENLALQTRECLLTLKRFREINTGIVLDNFSLRAMIV